MNLIGLPYGKDLVRLRKIMQSTLPYFPCNKCQHSARSVGLVTGLDEIAGMFGGTSFSSGYWHAWNHDPERGLYIDLTQDQFEGIRDKIIILPENTHRLKMEHAATDLQNRLGLGDDDIYTVKEIQAVIELFYKLH